jgi:hypothetical protein
MKTVNEMRLTTETVQSPALALEGIDDIKRGNGLALGVLRVGDGVTDDTFEEGLENTASLLVDHCMGLAVKLDSVRIETY